MGKTKIKTIDDSVPAEEPKKSNSAKAPRDKEDPLVAKLNVELGVDEEPAKSETAKAEEVILEGAQRPIESDKKDAIASLQHDKKQKPGKAKYRSKKYLEATKALDRIKTYPIADAIDMVKNKSYSKFNDKTNGSLEIHINTTQTGLRGLVSLPFASGKKLRIVAFGKGASESGADIFGDDSTIEEISQGKIDFDLVITTVDWMPKLAKVAKVLGPKRIMPNPKNGTIANSPDGLKKAIESFQSGKIEYKTEAKAPVIHLGLGKLNQPTEELTDNVKTLLQTLGKSKIKKVSLSPTMGPSIKLDLSSI